MKDFVTVNINTDHNYECGTEILARAGEGSTTSLDITIPEALLSYDAYLDFEKPNGESIRTPRLEIVDGVAHYDIAQYVLTEHGYLKVQVVLQGTNGEIWKSSVKQYAIQKSINAVDDIPDKEDFITEVQKLVDELNKEVSELAEMLSNDPDFVDKVVNGIEVATWVNTITGEKLRFFFGTQAEYEALADTSNLFAIITDDTTKDELLEDIEELKTTTASHTTKIENHDSKLFEHTNAIAMLETFVNDQDATIAAQNKAIAAAEKNIADLTTKVATHTTQISELQAASGSSGTSSYTKIYEADLSSGGTICLVGTTTADALTDKAVYLVVYSPTSASAVTGVLTYSSSCTYISTALAAMYLSVTESGTVASVYVDSQKTVSGTVSFYQIGTVNSI